MFLHRSSLIACSKMSVLTLLDERTGVSGYGNAHEVVKEHVEQMVDAFLTVVENRAFTTQRFSYVHDDSLQDELVDAVLRTLHKVAKIEGSVDVTDDIRPYCRALAAAFEGDAACHVPEPLEAELKAKAA